MPILTPRLQIQPRRIGEGPLFHKIVTSNLEHLKEWMPWCQAPQTIEDCEAHCRESVASFILRKEILLSIYLKGTNILIGSSGFHEPNWDLRSFEIGYWLAKEYEGKGYITETVNALTQYAFKELQAQRVEIRCDEDNTKSLSVMTRLGYTIEGVLRNESFKADGKRLRNTIISSRIDNSNLTPLEAQW